MRFALHRVLPYFLRDGVSETPRGNFGWRIGASLPRRIHRFYAFRGFWEEREEDDQPLTLTILCDLL